MALARGIPVAFNANGFHTSVIPAPTVVPRFAAPAPNSFAVSEGTSTSAPSLDVVGELAGLLGMGSPATVSSNAPLSSSMSVAPAANLAAPTSGAIAASSSAAPSMDLMAGLAGLLGFNASPVLVTSSAEATPEASANSPNAVDKVPVSSAAPAPAAASTPADHSGADAMNFLAPILGLGSHDVHNDPTPISTISQPGASATGAARRQAEDPSSAEGSPSGGADSAQEQGPPHEEAPAHPGWEAAAADAIPDMDLLNELANGINHNPDGGAGPASTPVIPRQEGAPSSADPSAAGPPQEEAPAHPGWEAAAADAVPDMDLLNELANGINHNPDGGAGPASTPVIPRQAPQGEDSGAAADPSAAAGPPHEEAPAPEHPGWEAAAADAVPDMDLLNELANGINNNPDGGAGPASTPLIPRQDESAGNPTGGQNMLSQLAALLGVGSPQANNSPGASAAAAKNPFDPAAAPSNDPSSVTEAEMAPAPAEAAPAKEAEPSPSNAYDVLSAADYGTSSAVAPQHTDSLSMVPVYSSVMPAKTITITVVPLYTSTAPAQHTPAWPHTIQNLTSGVMTNVTRPSATAITNATTKPSINSGAEAISMTGLLGSVALGLVFSLMCLV